MVAAGVSSALEGTVGQGVDALRDGFEGPAMGLSALASSASPAPEPNVFAPGSPSRTSPGWSASQSGAVNGPTWAEPPHACVQVRTPHGSGPPVPFRCQLKSWTTAA